MPTRPKNRARAQKNYARRPEVLARALPNHTRKK